MNAQEMWKCREIVEIYKECMKVELYQNSCFYCGQTMVWLGQRGTPSHKRYCNRRVQDATEDSYGDAGSMCGLEWQCNENGDDEAGTGWHRWQWCSEDDMKAIWRPDDIMVKFTFSSE
jgi:hypothetical protein